MAESHSTSEYTIISSEAKNIVACRSEWEWKKDAA
jgi:hypothetical protein